jgi:hypothetical protein
MIVANVHSKQILFLGRLDFSPAGETGEGLVRKRTLSRSHGRERRGMRPIPPPFPNGKGAACVMIVANVHSKQILFLGRLGFSPAGETGEGLVRKRTLSRTLRADGNEGECRPTIHECGHE